MYHLVGGPLGVEGGVVWGWGGHYLRKALVVSIFQHICQLNSVMGGRGLAFSVD